MDKEKVRLLIEAEKVNGRVRTDWVDAEYDVKKKVFRFTNKDGERELEHKDEKIKAVLINDAAEFARLVDGSAKSKAATGSNRGNSDRQDDGEKGGSGQEA